MLETPPRQIDVVPSSVSEKDTAESDKCEFLEVFTEEKVFVTILNNIKNFRTSKGRESFSL